MKNPFIIAAAICGIAPAIFVYFWMEPVLSVIAPIAIALAPLAALRSRLLKPVTIAAAVLMGVFAFVGQFTVGMLFVPSAILFAIAAARAGKPAAPAI
jgi:hypothetical protein